MAKQEVIKKFRAYSKTNPKKYQEVRLTYYNGTYRVDSNIIGDGSKTAAEKKFKERVASLKKQYSGKHIVY